MGINRILFISLVIWIASLLWSCQSKSKSPKDTTSSGQMNFAIDESFKQLADNELMVFHSTYKAAKVTPFYMNEQQAMELFLKDSFKMILIGRNLDSTELRIFNNKHQYLPSTVKVAIDGISIIVNPSNKLDRIDMGRLTKIFSGEIKDWKSIDPKLAGQITVVADNQGGSNARYIRDSVLKGKPFGKNVYAVKTNQEVIDYISKTPNAIGFIGVNLISKMTDSEEQEFAKTVKTLMISKTDLDDAFLPYQAYLATKDYPLTRTILLVINEAYKGLATGFSNFFASDRGQRIVLKEGLLPVGQPIRIVDMNPTNDIFK